MCVQERNDIYCFGFMILWAEQKWEPAKALV